MGRTEKEKEYAEMLSEFQAKREALKFKSEEASSKPPSVEDRQQAKEEKDEAWKNTQMDTHIKRNAEYRTNYQDLMKMEKDKRKADRRDELDSMQVGDRSRYGSPPSTRVSFCTPAFTCPPSLARLHLPAFTPRGRCAVTVSL